METKSKPQEKESNSPKVSASKYPGAALPAFPVRFRLKGQADGPVYEGQRQIRPCAGCQSGR
jgi:hypothetical protein